MEHTLTLELSPEIYEPLTRTAKEEGKTLEELAVEWLLLAIHYAQEDPLEEFIGTVHSDVPDWSDQHDKYLGQALMSELGDAQAHK